MKACGIFLAIICLLAVHEARSDSFTESAQQALKDQGFYYGEITGRKDAETTASIRRYQIRNGLKITGEMNAETQKSLGVKGNAPLARVTPPPTSPVPRPSSRAPAAFPDEDPERQEMPAVRGQTFRQAAPAYVPAPRDSVPQASGIFDDTPFEAASPEQQLRVLVSAQSLLARQGYYRSEIDGVFGPGMEFALRAYQTRFGLDPSGRLDRETLAVLGLLPGQRAPGLTAPRRNILSRPTFIPRGERVYTPR